MIKVFVSGCFDLLHPGHLEFLEYAKRQGDYLIVSIASDDTLKKLKRQPILSEHDRYLMVRALRCVDECFISRGAHDNTDCLVYVNQYRPDVWVLSDSDALASEKQALAEDIGCELVYNFRPDNGWSTTKLIQHIKTSHAA